jgi:hypothetical protein
VGLDGLAREALRVVLRAAACSDERTTHDREREERRARADGAYDWRSSRTRDRFPTRPRR